MVFSANPNDVEFFLGKNINCSADEVRRDYGSIKPCIRGSDAHKLSKINVFESNRYTWIKADPTFEGLKQIIYEPEERVRIQEFHPEGKRGYEVIDKVILSGKICFKINEAQSCTLLGVHREINALEDCTK